MLGVVAMSDEWSQASDDFRTLERAKEIVNNKDRLEAVKEFATKQKEKIDAVVDEKYLKAIGAR